MNHLLIGTADKTDTLLQLARPGSLLIDDGPVADAFLEQFPRAKLFDPTVHSFNPLKGMDYKRARDFAQILYTASPEGKDTLTVRNGKRSLAKLVLANTTRLDHLQSDDEKDADAVAMLDEVLFSPVLRSVLCGAGEPFRFGRRQMIVARINRAVLGDFDAFVLALLLIGQHQEQVVFNDGGFYLRPLHLSLIRQDRLTASIHFLAELPPQLQQAVLTIKDKHFMRLLPDDAEALIGFTDNPTGNPKNLM